VKPSVTSLILEPQFQQLFQFSFFENCNPLQRGAAANTNDSGVSLTDCALKTAAAVILIKTWDKSVKAKKNKDVNYCVGNTYDQMCS